MKRFINLLIIPVILLGMLSCENKKAARKAGNKYFKESTPIVYGAQKYYILSMKFVKSFKMEKKDKWSKGIDERIKEYKTFIEKLEKIPGDQNSLLKKIKSGDLKMLKCHRDVFKEYKAQVKKGKAPHESAKVIQLKEDYKKYFKDYNDSVKKYSKKYKKKKYKKKRKKRRKKRR
jgi:hypothetical protein